MRRYTMYLGLALAAFPLTACAAADVTPATLAKVLASARGGDTVILGAGDYGDVTIPRGEYSPRLVLDARQARFSQVTLRGVSGVEVRGGTVVAPRMQTFGVAIDRARDIRIVDMVISGAGVAVAISRSQGVDVVGNDFDRMRSDGVNIAGSQKILVERNRCRNFDPIRASYDAAGKLVTDGDHPDCVQAWSIAGEPPTADVRIIGNTATGFMQGIFFGNRGQGGYDNIVIRDNVLSLSLWNGIVLWEARGAEVTGNTVTTIKGARANNFPFKPVTSWINLSGENITACDNSVDKPRFSTGVGRCPRRK